MAPRGSHRANNPHATFRRKDPAYAPANGAQELPSRQQTARNYPPQGPRVCPRQWRPTAAMVDARGAMVDALGAMVDVMGAAADVMGVMVDVIGAMVDVKGAMIDPLPLE